MATVKHAGSKGMYSWWWNSHISPKNSKWLQENLTDMDTKVKHMIKLIEEDADSFARRAEMYYKKRPELMKLVEEFYRAYRALAERYDHATGVLRHAHRTIAEAFPNQVPMVFVDDSPGSTATEVDPRTPEMPPPVRALLEPDELQNDAVGLSSHAVKKNGAFPEESDSSMIRKGPKGFNDFFDSEEAINHVKFAEGRARRGLNFHDVEEKEQSPQNNEGLDLRVRVPSESDRVSKAEMEILTLKSALARLESEKEAGLFEYQQSLERLSNLEREVFCAQEDSRGLNERASKAEAEVQTLKDSLTKLGAERETNLLRYQQCLEKINNLENSISHAQKDARELNERASKTEIEAQALLQDLARVETEKEDALAQYKQCSEAISNLEEKLLNAEESARRMTERAEKAEGELETLKLVVIELTKDKEAAALQYQQCLEKISSLENKLACAQDEAQRLNSEIDDGVTKLKGAEERCSLLERTNQSLHNELESLLQKMGDQSQELTEKQKELGRLWTSIQEERLRFMEAETAFQTLQHLHSQSQEELRSLAMELQNRAQILQDIETRNQGLEFELQRIKEENNSLNELNLSSAMSIKNLQDEILSLRETTAKLDAEVELRVDQRNALQQEIYCLKEELNDFNKRHQDMVGQLESVSLNPENFASSVKELQDENTKLKDVCKRDSDEKLALLEKFKIMEKLVEKNAFLENSLSDLNVELEGVRGRVKTLEESCQSLLKEKSTLAAEKDTLNSQIQIATENLEKVSEKNNFLENSLFDANAELEALRLQLRSLENSCLLLGDEKSGLIRQREGLISQLDVSEKKLEAIEKRYQELEEKYVGLEKDRESILREVEQLQKSLEAEKQEHASTVQLNETQKTAMESQINFLQRENLCRKKEYEEEQHKAMNAQIENFVLQKCAQDLEEKNLSLLLECRKLLEASKLSEKLICELELANSKKQMEIKSLFDQITILRMGLYQMSRTLKVDAIHGYDDKDQSVIDHVFGRLQEMQNSLLKSLNENQQLVIEISVLIALLGQLKLEAENLATEKNSLHQELKVQSEQFSELQNRSERLADMNEELRSKVIEGVQREEMLQTEIGYVHGQLSVLQREYQSSLEENCKVIDEKRSLMKEFSDLGKEKHNLEEENYAVVAEAISQSNISLIFKNVIADIFEEIKHLSDNLDKLKCVNNDLRSKMIEGGQREEVLQTEVGYVRGQLLVLQKEYQSSLEENCKVLDENRSLMKKVSDLGKEKHNLEEENYAVVAEAISQSNISLIFKNVIADIFEEIKHLSDNLDKLKCVNNDLRSKMIEGGQREEVLQTEVGYVRGQLLVLQKEYQSSLEENCKVLDENRSLMKKVSDLGKEKHNLEEENYAVFAEAISQSNISLIFKNAIADNSEEIKHLSEDLDKLKCVNNDLEEKVRIMERTFDDMQMENSHLKDSLKNLENELVSVRSVADQLNGEVAKGQDLLCQKENALLEAEQILSVSQEERAQLHKVVEDLKTQYEEVKLIAEDQKKQVSKLSRDYDHQIKETESLLQANQKFGDELSKVNEEIEERKHREESLSVELQNGRNEVELWETQAAALFGELQIFAVREALIEEKAHELRKECEVLQCRSISKAMEVEELERSVRFLERENGGLKAQLAAYVPAVVSLMDSVASLESRTLLHPKLPTDYNEAKDSNLGTELHAGNCQQTSEDRMASVPDGFSNLQDIHMRIKAIEKSVQETEKLSMLENLNLNSKLETAMRQIEELRLGSSLRQESARAKKHVKARQEGEELGHGLSNNFKMQRPTPEISEEDNGMMTKDIMLDQTSESSSYGLSRRETEEVDEQMLELWQTTDHDGNIDLKVGKAQKIVTSPTKHLHIGTVKAHKGKNPSTESLVKELGVDKESSKQDTEPNQEGSKRKILERLDSDAQKLANLQITVQDLKRKVEITETSKKGKGIEYGTVKEQLEEAEVAIMKLFDVNRKLMTHVEDGSRSLDGKSALESDESGSFRRRKVSEEARRGSEKIGRLQLEVQKIQFLLLKLDDEKESRGRTKITEHKTRVLLRDYLYGGRVRTSQKRKKAPFCACMQPPTKGD